MKDLSSIHILKKSLLEVYKEGHKQGFLQAKTQPFVDETKAFVSAYSSSQTKRTIDGLKPQQSTEIILNGKITE